MNSSLEIQMKNRNNSLNPPMFGMNHMSDLRNDIPDLLVDRYMKFEYILAAVVWSQWHEPHIHCCS